MITIEDKIELFRKIVLKNINKEFQTLEKKLLDKKKVESLVAEKEAKEKKDKYVEKFITKIENDIEKELLDFKKMKKEELLKLKNDFIEQVYYEVLNQVDKFLQKKDYFEILEKLIGEIQADIAKYDKILVYVTTFDYNNNSKKIKNFFNRYNDSLDIELKKSYDDIRGGVIIFNIDKTVKFDLSLKSIIKRNKDFIGNEVQKMLRSKGEVHE